MNENLVNEKKVRRNNIGDYLIYLSMIVTVAGYGMKVSHYPGCNEMLILGMLGLSISSLIIGFRKDPSIKGFSKFFTITFHVLLSIMIQGFLFKIMHWPGCNEMLIFSITFISIIFFIRSVAIRTSTHRFIHVFLNVGVSILAIYFLFFLMHWPGVNELMFVGSISFVISFVAYFMSDVDQRRGLFGISDKSIPIVLIPLFSMLLIANNNKIKITDSMLSQQVVLHDEMVNKIYVGDLMQIELAKDAVDSAGDGLVKSKLKAIDDVDGLAQDLIKNIDDLKLLLLKEAGEAVNNNVRVNDFNSLLWVKYNDNNPLLPAKLNANAIMYQSNREVSWRVLGPFDENTYQQSKAYRTIWMGSNEYRDKLVEICGTYSNNTSNFKISLENNSSVLRIQEFEKLLTNSDQNVNPKDVTKLLDLYASMYKPEKYDMGDYNSHWVEKEFGGESLISVLNKLSKLQLEIIEGRNKAISMIANR
jgi:hypothetical protein